VTLAVALDRVSKRYAVGDRRGVFAPWRKRQTLWALREVDLHVAPGDSVGLIGHNGAGKTTVLRLLAGITRATNGSVRTSGRVASLINLGAGFHPELTGRENIYLNGVILGLSRREVQARFDEIVDFADLGSYIDTPLKRYSSGMFARLGFAVAAHVEPDVLLVDEVLSVGDVAFQDRSIRKMLSFRDSGQAVLFVSHNLSAVEMMCQRTVWLDHGRVRMAGPTAEVVRAYLDDVDEGILGERGAPSIASVVGAEEASDASTLADAASRGLELAAIVEPSDALAIGEVVLEDDTGRLCSDFEYGAALGVRIRCVTQHELCEVWCRLTVRGDYGPLFEASSERFAEWSRGRHEVTCRFEELPLLPGLYRLEVEVGYAGAPEWGLPRAIAAFRVVTDLAEYGSDSVVGATKSRGGFLAVGYTWRIRSVEGETQVAGLHLPGSSS
jgi:ABC-type polysaccharide/polyol phosphate transport system ATPase subunit